MNVLWVATKAPWPPVDGGRLLLWNTLAAFRDAGHQVTLVAPVDPTAFDLAEVEEALASRCRPVLVPAVARPAWRAALRALARGVPWTIERHRRPEVAARVEAELAAGAFDLVHAEQLQALAQVPRDVTVPCYLRAQNVESDLWHAIADSPSLRGRWLRRPVLRFEATRLARWEARAVTRADGTLALTAADAERLGAMSGATNVQVVPAPFVDRMPAADRSLDGAPAVVLLGSDGWPPNRDGALWFLQSVWPRIVGRAAAARLHVFGMRLDTPAPGIVLHGALADSRDAFAPGSVLVVPLTVASGIRMKILESWARGIPVVATPAAAGGLIAEPGRDLLVAEGAEAMADEVLALGQDRARYESMVAAGRRQLRAAYSASAAVEGFESAWSSLGGDSPKADVVMNSA